MSKNKKGNPDAKASRVNNRTINSTRKSFNIDFTPQTPNQEQLVKQIEENEIIFATGYPGTGKTFSAIACAVKALLNEECDKILVTRPAVVAGDEIGFMPGDEAEKQDVYMSHIYEAFYKLLPESIFESYFQEGKIEIRAIAFLRGSNFENTYVIVDECENLDRKLFYLLSTRICENSKVIFCGDSGQVDLKKAYQSGLDDAINRYGDIEGVAVTRFTIDDCQRSPIVKEIIKAYYQDKEEQTIIEPIADPRLPKSRTTRLRKPE